tara:strand:+ start:10534 stop:12090 length:1557 start_codon:yes stop_codon:yes gene_type:complete
MNIEFKHLLSIVVLFIVFSCSKKVIDSDILIKNGIVYNGLDTIPKNHSIAIKDGVIIFIGDESLSIIKATKTIDAKGLIVCPGFIDPHTHADRDLITIEKSHNKPFLYQGVTTVIVGNDGSSFYPTIKYKKLYKDQRIGTNIVLLVGHGTIREQVIGKNDRKATDEEIIEMQKLVQQEMTNGAFGLSTGLFYAPGSYSNTEEIIALAKTTAKNHGIYDTHLRDESSYNIGLIPAIEEAIEIGRQAKLPIHISHIKCLGIDVWHQSDSIIDIIEKARKEGIDVTANQYPYDASATGLQAAVVPRWAESGGKDSIFTRYNNPNFRKLILEETTTNIKRRGGPDKLLIVKSTDSIFIGKDLLEISKVLEISPAEAVFEILKKGYARVASFNMTPYDIENLMKQDWVVTSSDGNTGHPRKYGSFPRKYHQYVKQKKVIDLPTYINNCTSRTADIFKIPKRGKLIEGNYADIIIFKPEAFKDKADYINAFQLAEGIEYSIINGKVSIEKGISTEKLNGKVLDK